MKHLLKLRRQRAAVKKDMEALHSLSVEEDRDLTDEEKETYNDYKTQISSFDERIARAEEIASLEDDIEEAEAPEVRAVVTRDEEDKKNEPGVWKHFGEQLEAVYRAARPGATPDSRLSTRAATGASEGVGADGGFLVQSDFSDELLRQAIAESQIANRCRRVGVGAGKNGLKMNAMKDLDRTDGNRLGGVQVYWEGEADEMTASRPKFTQMEWKLKKLTGLFYATDELLEDATAMGQIAQSAFAEEFSYKIDDSILNGSGAGEPLGILNSPSLVTVAKESGQAADTVLGENVINMRARQFARSRPNSVWLINQDVEPSLHKLTVYGQTTANEFIMYRPANGLAGQQFDTLYGRPVIAIEQARTVGDVGDIMLCDFSQYMIVDKGGLKSDMSIHVRFQYNESAFRFILRIDGQPLWYSPLTPANGSNSQSPFIALAARA